MINKPIRDRLENWGKCQRGGTSSGGGTMRAKETRSASPYGGQGYKCMTGVICNLLATSATGPSGWRETRSDANRSGLDFEDAKLVTDAWVRLPDRPKSLLKLCYILNSPPAVICRRLGIRHWPASHFKHELAVAESEIQKVLDMLQQRNRIPANNLIPSLTCDSPSGGVAVSDETESPAD